MFSVEKSYLTTLGVSAGSFHAWPAFFQKCDWAKKQTENKQKPKPGKTKKQARDLEESKLKNFPVTKHWR